METYIKKIIVEAGEKTLEFFGNVGVHYTKTNPNDVVTKADLASEKILVDAIKHEYPDHGIISEESLPYQADAEYMWYIDPLDGTRNFASRVPLYGIIIGVSYRGEMKYGSIYLPVTNELFFAEAGKGTTLNGRKVRCSDKKEWDYSYGMIPLNLSKPEGITILQRLGRASEYHAWMNSLGSAAVSAAYMADGRRDWCFFQGGEKVWDYAGPAIIMKEAGCVVTSRKGEPWHVGAYGVAAANHHLHPKLLEILHQDHRS